ncbi:unnamed protein product [Ceutorhynchus assimilis]|uniref:Uncharacterized protein n=1 Tax=Ceutorhynchus assimilis TaxID=467358 RepID=A0A9N9QMH9_9CUCU|nr:unnamed protein product [Ceutorhynchus assimilis]
MNEKWLLILVQPFVLGCLGSPDSCFYCGGTRECKDPMDFDEVSARLCEDNSVCVKYMTTSENHKHEIVAHELTYRKCFKPIFKKKDNCKFLEKSEKMALRELNLSLIVF